MKGSNRTGLIFIFLTVFIDVVGFGIIIPVIPTLIEDLTGLGMNESAAYGGMLLISFAFMQFLFSPVLGELSDQFGRRPVLLVALFGLGVDYLMHGFAPNITWLFVGRILAGITGASFTVAMAYAADISSEEDRAKNFGILGAAFGLGFIVGPAIGGIFGAIDVRLPFFVAAGLALTNFLFGFFLLPESLDQENRRPAKPRNMIPGVSLLNIGKYGGIGALIFALFLAETAGQALPATWSFFTMEQYDWNEAEVGYSLAFVGVLVAIVQGALVSKTVNRFGETAVIIGGFILWSIGMILFSFAVKSWMIYAFMIPYALGGVAGPTLKGIISNSVSQKEQGNLQGSLTSMTSITTIIGPAIASFLFYKFASDEILYFPGAPYLASGLLLVFATITVVMALLRRKKIQDQDATLSDS